MLCMVSLIGYSQTQRDSCIDHTKANSISDWDVMVSGIIYVDDIGNPCNVYYTLLGKYYIITTNKKTGKKYKKYIKIEE